MSKKSKYQPPPRSAGDTAHAIVRSGLGAIPIAGAGAVELLKAIVSSPLEKRRTAWMEEVGKGLKELERKMGVVLEELQENDAFLDVALEATQIAIRTSTKEKKEALKNAILNSALPDPPAQYMQNLFLSLVDSLTIWHIKLLELFENPQDYVARHQVDIERLSMGALSHLVERAFPELSGKRSLYDLIWKDLYSRALVGTDNLHTMMTGGEIFVKRTTEIGSLFMDYIKSPIDD